MHASSMPMQGKEYQQLIHLLTALCSEIPRAFLQKKWEIWKNQIHIDWGINFEECSKWSACKKGNINI